MLIDLNDVYGMMMIMMLMIIMMMMLMMVKTQNSHNLANFEDITSRFCMVIDINNTYGLYFHAKSKVYYLGYLSLILVKSIDQLEL